MKLRQKSSRLSHLAKVRESLSLVAASKACRQTLDQADVESNTTNSHPYGVLILSAISLSCMYYLFRSPRTGYFILESLLGVILPTGQVAQLLQTHLRLLYLIWWALGSCVLYLILPVAYIRLILKQPLKDFGFQLNRFGEHLPIYALLFLPVALGVVCASFLPSFQSYYPLYRNPQSLFLFLSWELVYAIQFLALEFFFRGFMLHGLKSRYGSAALWIMVLPYFMIHFGKPWPEAMGALVAGSVLGILSLRTGSIFGGVAIHIAVALLMDLLACMQRGWLVF